MAASFAHLYIVGRNEAIVAIEPNQDPVWIRGVVYIEVNILWEGQLLVRLSRVLVESAGLLDGLCL